MFYKTRRHFSLSLAGLATALCHLPAIAQSGSYPNKPIKIVAPFTAGSGTDGLARIVAEALAKELPGTVIVENRPGASGTIGAAYVARSPADGYILLLANSSTNSSAPILIKNLPYDPEKDFKPIGNLVEVSFLLIVDSLSRLNNLTDLSAWLKAKGSDANFAYGSPTTQIAGMVMLKRMNRVATGIPYKSNPEAVTDLLGGRVPFMFIDQPTGLTLLRSGKVRALAVTGLKRLQDAPDVPTMQEAGFNDFVIQTWTGLQAPAAIPEDIHHKLDVALRKVMATPAVLNLLRQGGRPVEPLDAQSLSSYLRTERHSWTSMVLEAGLQPE